MKTKWKNVKIGDTLKDGSVVTQVHRTHKEPCCKLIYDGDREFICSYRHILQIDVSNLPTSGKKELEETCTFVPLEENYEITSDSELSFSEKYIIEQFCRNEPIAIYVDTIKDDSEEEIYDFHFNDIKRVYVKQVILKSEPQKINDNTYWLTCYGIEYLMNKYKVILYCNENIINKIEPAGELECFCISTNTGRYET